MRTEPSLSSSLKFKSPSSSSESISSADKFLSISSFCGLLTLPAYSTKGLYSQPMEKKLTMEAKKPVAGSCCWGATAMLAYVLATCSFLLSSMTARFGLAWAAAL